MGADGEGSVTANALSAGGVQGEKGRDGVPRRMKESGVTFLPHLETIAHTSYKRTLGICTLPSTRTQTHAAMPNEAPSTVNIV